MSAVERNVQRRILLKKPRRQDILFVTERAVFRLTDAGVELTEIAPGIDLQQQVLALMDFAPAISPSLKTMDAEVFL